MSSSDDFLIFQVFIEKRFYRLFCPCSTICDFLSLQCHLITLTVTVNGLDLMTVLAVNLSIGP